MPDIDFGQLSEALNDKMDRDAHNVQSPSAVVIAKQDPTSDNDYTWYRLYSDGWVEQGGSFTGLTNGSTSWLSKSVSLPITMANTNYSIIASDCGLGSNNIHGTYNNCSSATQWEYYYFNAAVDKIVSWQVSGMAS